MWSYNNTKHSQYTNYSIPYGTYILLCWLLLYRTRTLKPNCRADSRLAPSQWETALQSNTVSHWLGANPESALQLYQSFICQIFQKKPKHVFAIYMIPPHWHGTSSWNPSSCKTGTYLYYIVNIMADDDLAMKGDRASATMIFTMMNQINSVPTRQGLRFNMQKENKRKWYYHLPSANSQFLLFPIYISNLK